MDITKLLEDSVPLVAAAELDEKFPRKVQNVLNMAALSLDQKKTAGKTESSKMSSNVLSSFTLKFYCKTYILHIQINYPFLLI